MSDWLLNFAHRHLKLIFVACFIGSSSIFFDGDNIPVPHPVLGVIGIGLGIGIELCYWMFSTDLTKSITKRDAGGILGNFIFTLFGMGASWFLFTNAALVLGWAPKTAILPGIDRTHWAVIIGGVVSGLVLALSLRREHPKDETDITAIAYSVTRVAPYASNEEKLRLMGELSTAASKYSHRPEARSVPRIVEALPAGQAQEAHRASGQAVAPRPKSQSQPAPSLNAPRTQAPRPGLWSRARNLFRVQEVPGGQAALPKPAEDTQASPAQTREAPLRPDQPTTRPAGERVVYPPTDPETPLRLLEAALDETPPPSSGAEWPAEETHYPPFPAVRREPVGGRGNHQTPVQGVYHVIEGSDHQTESERTDGSSFP